MKYQVKIEELLCEYFVVEADTLQEAKDKICRLYNAGIFALVPGHLEVARFNIYDYMDLDEWEEIWWFKKLPKIMLSPHLQA